MFPDAPACLEYGSSPASLPGTKALVQPLAAALPQNFIFPEENA